MTTKGKWLALEKKLHEIALDLPWSRTKRFYEGFNSRLKLAAANLKRGPNPGLKLAAAYFSRREIVRLYRRSRNRPWLIFVRINGPESGLPDFLNN